MQKGSRSHRFMNSTIAVFSSKRLLAVFLVAAPVLVFFLAVVAVLELPLGRRGQISLNRSHPHTEQTAPAEGITSNVGALSALPWLEIAVRVALVFLVLILLYVPISWVFQFSRLSGLAILSDDKPDEPLNSEARAEFLGWLTAISVPYLVLGFSMTIEFHALLEDPAKGVGAIAAIMVLYALSVLSSFLYIEVRDLRQGFSKEIRETHDWFRYSLALANYQTPIGTPAQNVATLLKKWVELLERGSAASDRREIRQNLLGTLLASYIKEESENICGNLTPDRTPIWVSEIRKAAEKRGSIGDVAFIATNVGFYAQYLSTTVKGLAHSLSKDQCVVLATVTYVLPPFWWNWPYANEHHGIYEPVKKFRETLIDLAREDASTGKSLRVFRRMLVRDPSEARSVETTKLSDKTLRDVFESTFSTNADWMQMKQWRIIKGSEEPLTSRVRSPVNQDQLAGPIRWTKGDSRPDNDESQVYWMSDGVSGDEANSESIVSYYRRLMHPVGGGSEVCGIDFDTFRAAFSLDSNKGTGGLNGCPEITFIGVCEAGCSNVWESKPDFGLAFLSNMTKGHDSIFLAVVVAESLVEDLWRSVCDTLNPRLIDGLKSSNPT